MTMESIINNISPTLIAGVIGGSLGFILCVTYFIGRHHGMKKAEHQFMDKFIEE